MGRLALVPKDLQLIPDSLGQIPLSADPGRSDNLFETGLRRDMGTAETFFEQEGRRYDVMIEVGEASMPSKSMESDVLDYIDSEMIVQWVHVGHFGDMYPTGSPSAVPLLAAGSHHACRSRSRPTLIKSPMMTGSEIGGAEADC